MIKAGDVNEILKDIAASICSCSKVSEVLRCCGNNKYTERSFEHEGDSYTVEVVDQNGGTEGDGEYVDIVIKMTVNRSEPQYFVQTGYYSSWSGTEWSNVWEQCEPKEVTTTKYFVIK